MAAIGSASGATYERLALLASPTERAQEAARIMASTHDWVPFDEAEAVVVLAPPAQE